AMVAVGVDGPLVKRPWLDTDRVRERLRAPAERVDARRDRVHPIAFLLARVADAGELGRLGGLGRDDGEGGEDVGAVAHVGTNAVQLSGAANRDRAGAMRDVAAHHAEELEESRVALTALAQRAP